MGVSMNTENCPHCGKSNGRDDFDGPVDDWGLSRKNSVDS